MPWSTSTTTPLTSPPSFAAGRTSSTTSPTAGLSRSRPTAATAEAGPAHWARRPARARECLTIAAYLTTPCTHSRRTDPGAKYAQYEGLGPARREHAPDAARPPYGRRRELSDTPQIWPICFREDNEVQLRRPWAAERATSSACRECTYSAPPIVADSAVREMLSARVRISQRQRRPGRFQSRSRKGGSGGVEAGTGAADRGQDLARDQVPQVALGPLQAQVLRSFIA